MLKICLNNNHMDFEEQLILFNKTFNIDFTKEKWQLKHLKIHIHNFQKMFVYIKMMS